MQQFDSFDNSVSDEQESEESAALKRNLKHDPLCSTPNQFHSDLNSQTDINGIHDRALPVVTGHGDIRYDIKMGWKPEDKELSGAPIPLMYNFDVVEVREYD